MTRKARTKGLALISVLMALSLCLMLLGAFLTTNRSYLRLFQGGKDRDTVRQAIGSAYEFCRFKIEEDKTWGGYFNDPQTYRFARLEVEELPPQAGSQGALLRGKLLDSGATFTVTVQNNLGQDSASAYGVPPRSCRFLIAGQAGRGQAAANVTVRGAAYFDSTVVASQGVSIFADELMLESRDPIHNQIRSQSDMDLPPLYHQDHGDGVRYQFRPDSGGNQGSKGTVWARGDLNLRRNPGEPPDPNILALAGQLTDARFISRGRTHYEIPSLMLEDIDVRGNELVIDPGYYVFNKTSLEYQDAGGDWRQTAEEFLVLERWSDKNSPDTIQDFYFMGAELEGAVGTYGSVRVPDRGGDGVPKAEQGADSTFAMQDGMNVSLSRQTLEIAADREVKVPGDFGFASIYQSEITPTLHFKDPAVNPDRPPNLPPDRGALTVAGDIDINGYVVGSGNLLAERDVLLRPNEADVDAGTVDDLAIFAGRDVVIEPASGVSADNIHFKGLVYAERNFDFSARRVGQTHVQTLTIEGALVARTGSVFIRNSQKTHLIYNPDYLDDLLKQRDDNRTQVELVVWQPG